MKKHLKFPSKRKLTRAELERYNRYAVDLFNVLISLREYHNCVTIFGSRKPKENDKYYQKALELGKKLAENGHIVVTGGGPGIMEAANRGASEANGKTVGFNINIPGEQKINGYAAHTVEFQYFSTRKLILAASSKVWVFFPGGFGTLDELFEALTLVRDGKTTKTTPIFLIGREYWKGLDELIKSRAGADGEFEDSNRQLYKITDNIDEVVEAANQIPKTED